VILSQSEPAEESYERAWAYYRAGNYARCRELADRLLADHGADDAGLTLKGMALAELDQPEEAIEAFRLAVQIRPDNEEAWAQLGTALVTEGHLAEAAESFRAALRIRRDNHRAMVDLSNVLFILGQVDEAIATLEEARRTRRGDLGILRNLAEMCASDGQSEIRRQQRFQPAGRCARSLRCGLASPRAGPAGRGGRDVSLTASD